jgi:pyruvate-formate lyase-activating enzyme
MNSFPVKSLTACPLKWEWSTLFLYMGTTNSCHRTSLSYLPPGEIGNFHNTAAKLSQRNTMLKGDWPERGNGCEYCRDIEDAGGMSDRTTTLKLCGSDAEYRKLIPVELLRDPERLEVTPTILEVYFTNRCNMSCIYCGPDFSTQWLNENKKYGQLEHHAARLSWEKAKILDNEYAERLAGFWKWLETNYRSLKMFHILGGEPFYQTETLDCIRFWHDHPNPDLHLKIVSNLKVAPSKFRHILQELQTLHTDKKCSSVGIIASLDCWGKEAEYIRTGLELSNWQNNFEYLIYEHPWAEVSINATMNALSIRTMPDLIEHVNAWNERRDRIIGEMPGIPKLTIVFNLLQGPEFMHAGIFREKFFDDSFHRILDLLPARNPWELANKEYMTGLWKVIEARPHNPVLIEKLKEYLTEMDRRRNTNWKEVFPWLGDLK